MNKITKAILAIVAIALIVWGIVAIVEKPSTSSTKATVKIGLVLPMTGNAGFLGESAQNAAELALKDAGVTKNDYKLVFEDDSFDPVKTVTAVNKMISVDHVSSIVTFGSGTSNAASPITEANKIPHFGLASDPTSAKGDYNYIHWTPPFKEGQLLAQELVRRGYKSVSIIGTNHPGTLAVTDSLRQALQGTDVKIVSYDLTNVGDKDFKTVINKVKTANPDIIVLEQFSPEIEITAKQIKELGIKTPVTSVETFAWSNQIGLFEGDWFVADAKVSPAFVAEYKAAYGKNPAPGASYIYDLVTLLVNIQEKSDKPIAAADIPTVLNQMGSYNSALFGNVAIDKDGFFITDASVQIIKDGKAEMVN